MPVDERDPATDQKVGSTGYARDDLRDRMSRSGNHRRSDQSSVRGPQCS